MRKLRPRVLRKEHAFETFGIITHLTFTYFATLGSGAACRPFIGKMFIMSRFVEMTEGLDGAVKKLSRAVRRLAQRKGDVCLSTTDKMW